MASYNIKIVGDVTPALLAAILDYKEARRSDKLLAAKNRIQREIENIMAPK